MIIYEQKQVWGSNHILFITIDMTVPVGYSLQVDRVFTILQHTLMSHMTILEIQTFTSGKMVTHSVGYKLRAQIMVRERPIICTDL